jgi:hypothetical protein
MKIPDDAIDTSTYVINTITKPEKYNNLFICYIALINNWEAHSTSIVCKFKTINCV